MNRVLVIGSSGYIGSALVPFLTRAGHDVETCDIAGEATHRDRFQSFSHSLRWGYDTIIMLAGKSSVAAAESDREEAFYDNLANLVEFATQLKASQRFIYASSASVYAVKGDQFHNIYDYTKFAADAALKLLRPENTWALRFGTVCGASPNIRLDLMINRMVWSAVTRGYVEVCNMLIHRPILAMTDLLRGVGQIVDGEVPAGIHNLASTNKTVGKIANIVARRMDVETKRLGDTPAYDFTMDRSHWFMPDGSVSSIVDDLIANHGEQWKKEKEDG